MPGFGDAIEALQGSDTAAMNICSSIDLEIIRHALTLTGTQSIRRRKLPAEMVVWLIIGMALFTDSSIENIVSRLGLSLDGNVSKSSVFEAREKLGSAPISVLFEMLCRCWTERSRSDVFNKFCVYAIDGTFIRVPDSDDNYSAFGKPQSRRSEAGYPQVRMVAAIDTHSRLMYGANIGPIACSEANLSAPVLERLPDSSICLMDRGFQGNERFWSITSKKSDRHFVCRVKENAQFIAQQQLKDGSVIGVILTTGVARTKNPELPKQLPVRVIDYQIDKNQQVRLFTSLMDSATYPASNIVDLYHERWEVELCFKEIKNDLFEQRMALRSRKPDGVYQEMWGALIMYNLIRRKMFLVAAEHKTDAARISFHISSVLIYNFFSGHSADPALGRLPERLRKLSEEMWRLRLPPRRAHRRFPRAVKVPVGPYPRKLPKERQSRS
jgi:hypothetical protein